jgi:hypothetical protein
VRVRGAWRPLGYTGIPPIVRLGLLTVQGLLIYVAASRGVTYLRQVGTPQPRPGTAFAFTGVEQSHLMFLGVLFAVGAFLAFTGQIVFRRPQVVAVGHGCIAAAYLALGFSVVLVNPLNAGLAATGLMHLAYVVALGSSIGTARGVARQTGG